MKRALTALLSLLLILCLCSGALAEITAPEWSMPIVKEKINLTDYNLQSPQGSISNEMLA